MLGCLPHERMSAPRPPPRYEVFRLRSQAAKDWPQVVSCWRATQLEQMMVWVSHHADPQEEWEVHPAPQLIYGPLTFDDVKAPFLLLGLRTGIWLLLVARPPVADRRTIYQATEICAFLNVWVHDAHTDSAPQTAHPPWVHGSQSTVT